MTMNEIIEQKMEEAARQREKDLPNELESLWSSYLDKYDAETGETLRTVSLAAIAFALRDIRDLMEQQSPRQGE